METKIEKLKNGEIKLVVNLAKEDLDGYFKKAQDLLVASFKMDGFRKGKVPPEVIKEKIDGKELRQEAIDIAIRESFARAVSQEKIDLLETIEMKILKNEPTLLEYQAVLISFPEIVLGDYSDFKVEKKEIKVADEEVDNTLKYIQNSRADYEDTDSPVKKGDRAEIDFEVRHEGKTIEGGKSENHPLIVGNGGFMPGFEDQILDMKTGDEKEFSIVAPNDYYQKAIAGQKIDFNIKIKKVQKVMLPEINDDFVKGLGKFETLVDLKKNIQEGLLIEKESKEKERVRLAILDKIIENSKLEIPQRLLDRQLDQMIKSFDEDLHRQGLELGLYLAQIKKTQEELRKDWHGQASKQVKSTLILREVGSKEGINVDEEEVMLAMNDVLKNFRSVEEASKYLDLDNFKAKVRNKLLNEKILEFLEGKTKLV